MQVMIEVDEEGTVAAAATAVGAVMTSLPIPNPPLVFDRPFMFMLVDESTGTVLFMGTVRDPSGSTTV